MKLPDIRVRRGVGEGGSRVLFRATGCNSNAESNDLLEIQSGGGDAYVCIKQIIICHVFFLIFQ